AALVLMVHRGRAVASWLLLAGLLGHLFHRPGARDVGAAWRAQGPEVWFSDLGIESLVRDVEIAERLAAYVDGDLALGRGDLHLCARQDREHNKKECAFHPHPFYRYSALFGRHSEDPIHVIELDNDVRADAFDVAIQPLLIRRRGVRMAFLLVGR